MADTPLHDAAKQGNKALVEKLLNKGDPINAVNSDCNTPLHLAFLNKQEEIVNLFLAHIKATSNYANINNNQGISHLHIASTRQDKDIVQGFIECSYAPIHPNSSLWPGSTPLDLAIEFKSPEVAQCLARAVRLEGFVDPQERTIMHELYPDLITVFRHNFSKIYRMVPACDRLPTFHWACFCLKPEHVEALIDRGADVNEPASLDAQHWALYTPLHAAIHGKSKEIVQLLLDRGADPNRRNSHYMTALHMALYDDDYQAKDTIVDRLYAAVTNKEAELMDLHGLTYLHVACTRNDVALVTKLLDQGADVNRKVLENVRNYSNFTPLHFAVLYRREETAKLLIERGAKVNFQDVETPLHLACMVGHEAIIELLLKHSADPLIIHPKSSRTTLHLLAVHSADPDWVVVYNDERDETYTDDCRKMGLARFVELMVKAGVDVDAMDGKGYTALHYACTNICEGCYFADSLMKWGADINAESKYEQTPLQLVMEDDYKYNGSNYVDLYDCVQRIKALGLEVNPKNEECCREIVDSCKVWEKNDRDWLRMRGEQPQAVQMPKREKERNDEIERMKKVKLTKAVSLYDFVKMEAEKAAAYVGSKELKKALEEKLSYQVYGYLVELQYWKASQCAASKKKAKGVKKAGKSVARSAAKRRRV